MYYEQTMKQFAKTLKNLSAILDKAAQQAEAKKVDMEVLFQSRLIADQFPLSRQIQIACDSAKFAAARLTNQEAPAHEDKEKTLPELACLDSVASYLAKFTEKDFAQSPTRHITQARWEGQYLTGDEYLHQHAIPNVYFHVTTAYAILRSNGIEVGKKDYLGTMPFKK